MFAMTIMENAIEEEEGTVTWRGEDLGMMQTVSPLCLQRLVGPALSSMLSSSSLMTSSMSTRMTTMDPLASAEGVATAAAAVATAVVFAYHAS
jgi:hypothetical protein